jgi:hypothetical protein
MAGSAGEINRAPVRISRTRALTVRLDAVLRRSAAKVDPAITDRISTYPAIRVGLAEQLQTREELWAVPLGALLPGVAAAGDPGPPHRHVSMRTHNVLRRSQLETWGSLALVTILDLVTLPNCGAKTIREIMTVAIEGWAEAGEDPAVGDDARADDCHPTDTPESRRLEPLRLQLIDSLAMLWAEGGFATFGEVLRAIEAGETPDGYRELRAAVGTVDLTEVIGLSRPAPAVWRDLLTFPERERLVLLRRISRGVGERATLADLGAELDVTRERVRQLEQKVLSELDRRLAEPDSAALRHLLARTERVNGEVCTPEERERAIQRLLGPSIRDAGVDPVVALGVARARIGPSTAAAGLLWSASAIGRLHALEEWASSRAGAGPLSRDGFTEILDRLVIPRAHLDVLLLHLRMRDHDGLIVSWGNTKADHAVAVLSLAGEPMCLEDIRSRVDEDANPRSFANSVQADPRILRVGKDAYGLRSWGAREYRGVVDSIEREIDEAGGGIPLARLVERLTADFGVAESSVRAYASDRRFILRAGSILAMREQDDPQPVTRGTRPEETRGAFRIAGVWNLRIEVTHDALRGSGRPLSNGAAEAAGLEPDLSFGVEFDGGSVMFSWDGRQPTLGSIRPILMDLDCVEGDTLLLPLDGPEPRTARVVRGVDLAAATGIQRLSLEAGAASDGGDEVVRLRIAEALGLPAGADLEDIHDRLAGRGDDHLAALALGEDEDGSARI